MKTKLETTYDKDMKRLEDKLKNIPNVMKRYRRICFKKRLRKLTGIKIK